MDSHITQVMRHYRGRIKIWDVVNEALNDDAGGYRESSPFYEKLGPSYITRAFMKAHQADPNAILLYNDFNIETKNSKSNFLYQKIRTWLINGIPIDGIGMQMHIDTNFTDYQGFSDNMQRFADLGLDIYITEMDVAFKNSSEYQKQAIIYKKIVQRCLAQPHCKSIQTWGITDRYTWLDSFTNPLLFDECFLPKPAYYSVQNALGGESFNALMLQAERYNEKGGVKRWAEFIGFVDDGDWIKFNNVNFNGGFSSIKSCYSKGDDNLREVTLRLDSLSGSIIASFTPGNTGDWDNFMKQQTSLNAVSGVHDLYFLFSGGDGVGNFDSFLFEASY